VYINDAFGTAHRAHASTAIIAEFTQEKAFGYLMNREIENLDKVIANPERPYIAVMGGAKVSDKIKIIENLIDKVDYLLLGGGMIFTFIYAKGGKIGKSLCETDMTQTCLDLMAKAESKGVKILIPVDVYSNNVFSNDGERNLSDSSEIEEGMMGLDIGPKSVEIFKTVLNQAKTILWNGPMGVFEFDNFQHGTKEIAYCIADATDNGAYSLVGGGDSLAALAKFNLKERVSYVSTGGGAMLEYLEGKVLPGIEAMG
jgi:phosphoglycerate kinase